MVIIRKAVYAGTWYPVLKSDVQNYVNPVRNKVQAIGAVCPHAGWIYSGKTAGKVYAAILPADTYILIGPNHSGAGSSMALCAHGSWEMPLGSIAIDEAAASLLIKNSEFLKDDARAHVKEHSLEVQCPFIQLSNPSARILPIIMRDHEPEICADIGRSLASTIKGSPDKKFVIIASSDMTHYEPASLAKTQDEYALREIVDLNPGNLLRVVDRRGITMCGSGPVAAMLHAAVQLGARKADVIDYTNSGEVTGDTDAVVAYAGIIVT